MSERWLSVEEIAAHFDCRPPADGEAKERAIVPTDRETERLDCGGERRGPGTGRLRLIEVKRRVSGAATIKVTQNEILYSRNKPDDFIPCDRSRIGVIR